MIKVKEKFIAFLITHRPSNFLKRIIDNFSKKFADSYEFTNDYVDQEQFTDVAKIVEEVFDL